MRTSLRFYSRVITPASVLRSTACLRSVAAFVPTVDAIKNLREASGAGLLDCKNALAKFSGDHTEALKFLKEKGLAKLQGRATAAVGHGFVAAVMAKDGKSGAIVEMNSETDFACRSDYFTSLVENIADQIAATSKSVAATPDSNDTTPEANGRVAGVVSVVDAPGDVILADGTTAAATVDGLGARLGERVVLRRAVVFNPPAGVLEVDGVPLSKHIVGAYVHAKHAGTRCGSRATMVSVSAVATVDEEVLRKVATEVAISACTYYGLEGYSSWDEYGMLAKADNTLKKMIEGRAKSVAANSGAIKVTGVKTMILGAQ